MVVVTPDQLRIVEQPNVSQAGAGAPRIDRCGGRHAITMWSSSRGTPFAYARVPQ
jgi:hypothetical protein